jgi:hypothetical protein
MNANDLMRRIRLYDSAAFRELELLRTSNMRAYDDLLWNFIGNMDCKNCTDIPPQLLAMLYESLGADYVDKSVFAKWPTMSDVGKANVCYGAGLPKVLPTGLAFSLFFSPFSTVRERHMIAGGLATSAQERGIQKIVLWLLTQIGTYSSELEQEGLQQFISDATRSLRKGKGDSVD